MFITKQNFGEKENIISLCHEEYYDASGSNFKRSRKEERHKTLITRECASLHLFHAVLIFFFCLKKWQLSHVQKLHKNRLSCTALKKKMCDQLLSSDISNKHPLMPLKFHYYTPGDNLVLQVAWVPFSLDYHQES